MLPDWPTFDASLNAVVRDTFGEPVVYQRVQAGQPVGEPVTITVVRENRVREETGTRASFEEISVNPSDLTAPPAKGDIVTAWGGKYTVVTMRQPDPYGMVVVTLQQSGKT
jgi:hypothetical protein